MPPRSPPGKAWSGASPDTVTTVELRPRRIYWPFTRAAQGFLHALSGILGPTRGALRRVPSPGPGGETGKRGALKRRYSIGVRGFESRPGHSRRIVSPAFPDGTRPAVGTDG